MKKNTTLLIRINDDLKKDIQNIADKNGVSVSEIINLCLSDIAKRGDLNLAMKEKLGVLKKELEKNSINIHTIKRVIEEAIEELELKDKINKVYLYGSFARGEETPKSDIDLRLETNHISGFEIGNLRYEIKEKTGRDVDISNEDSNKLDPDFYKLVKQDEICIYERPWVDAWFFSYFLVFLRHCVHNYQKVDISW